MAKKSIADQIEALRDEIREHDRKYYVDAAPSIEDRDYDRLVESLRELESENPELIAPDSPTQRVAGEPIEGFLKVKHARRMYSIDNTYDLENLKKWAMRVYEGTDPISRRIQQDLTELSDLESQLKGRKDLDSRKLRDEYKQRRKALNEEYESEKVRVEAEGIPIAGGYLVDPKVDGVAVSLRYVDGQLELAATRGDGQTGDDITHNIRASRSVPTVLKAAASLQPPAVLEIRAEVYMPAAEFQRLNKETKAAGEEPFANPRNATAGTLKQLDPSVVAHRKLKAVAHGRGEISNGQFDTHSAFLTAIKGLGIPTSPWTQTHSTIDGVWKFIDEFALQREELDFATDGVVVRVNRIALQEELGYTSKFPRWCMAYKYAAEQVTTTLMNIDWQIGKTGKLTPRAVMQPVFVAGTTVQHASLHNLGEVRRKDIRIGDTVVIEKAGEIIPQVVRVVVDKRITDLTPVVAPEKCPECGSDIDIDYDQKRTREVDAWERRLKAGANDDSAATPPQPLSELDETGRYCINPECPAQLRQRLLYFAGRGQMDIDGLGEKVVSGLVEKALVRRYGDLYRLTAEKLTSLDFEYKWSESGISTKVIAAINESKNIGLDQLIEALISGIGQKTAKAFADSFKTIKELSLALQNRTLDKLNVSDRDVQKVSEFLDSGRGQAIIAELAAAGLKACKGSVSTSQLGNQKPLFADVSKNGDLKKIERFVSKAIKGLGKDRLATIASAGLIQSYGDIYRLDEQQLAELVQIKRMSVVEANEQIRKIAESKNRGLQRLLTALSIRHVGTRLASILAEHFRSIDALQNAECEELRKVDDVGTIVAHSVYAWLNSERGKSTIKDLRSVDVKMEMESAEVRSRILEGKTLVITGTLSKYSREEVQKLIEEHGGRTTSSVSKNTSYLIAGADVGGTKFNKAQELNVPILSEDDFEKMLQS